LALIEKKTKRRIVSTLAAGILVCTLSLGAATANAVNPGTEGNRVVLDPGFGYRSIFEPLANRLYKDSPVTAYLPTRLPGSDWHYYGLKSKLTNDGYEVSAYKTDQLPSVESSLPSSSVQDPDPKLVLFKIKAETYTATDNGGILLHQKDNWKFYADQAAAGNQTEKERLIRTFNDASKFSVPIAGASGVVMASGAGENRTYSAYWTFDGKVGYSFESRTPISDFISVLYSFRPVINLLDVADIVLLPIETQFDLQVGRKEAFEPRENKFIALSSKPAVIGGSVYLPVADIVRIIQGQMQYVPKEHAVYLSENGYYNLLKLNLQTGEVYKKNAKIAKVPVHVEEGRTLVPLKFLTEQFGMKLDYDQTSKTVSIYYSRWFTNNRVPEKAVKADYPFTVFSTGGPSFRYENSRIGSGGGWSFVHTKPPQGYNGIKYNVYKVGIPLLPGSNELVYSDALTRRVINSIPITADLSPADIPFRYAGSIFYESLKMDLKLIASDGKAWPSGYVETASFSDITGVIQSGGFNYSTLRLTYRQADGAESKPISFQVAKDGSFSYRFRPEQGGQGTYIVTLYNPPGSLPKGDLAAIVTFVIVVK
jgi:hypothetical protein